MVARFKQSHRIDLAAATMAIDIPFVAAGPSGPVHLEMELSKTDGA